MGMPREWTDKMLHQARRAHDAWMKENSGGTRRAGGAPAAANAGTEEKMMARLEAIGTAMQSVQDTVKGIKESQKELEKKVARMKPEGGRLSASTAARR
eukprot:6907901-Prymnesium_polylepis.1